MGKEFLHLFEHWAQSYDSTVTGDDIQYKDVFLYYENILQEVVDRSNGHVLEFGVGTGNLTKKLLDQRFKVTGVEPSPAMRKMAEEKLGEEVSILDGDFIEFPQVENINTIVSTYAFHHLTDDEKNKAIALYSNILPKGGKIVFADTMYESMEAYNQAISDALSKGFLNLAKDLQREYYTTIPVLSNILKTNGFTVEFHRCNDFVWLMEGVKQ
jgi:putative AdoMet-dependent methyltransferase